jgi:hypothetical protein
VASQTFKVMPALAAAQAGLGGLQAIGGLVQSIGANKQLKKLFEQRTPFKTAKEVFQNRDASQYFAQQGYSDQTLNYLTNQSDRAFSASTGAALRLGADPNMISGLYDQYMNDVFKVGANSNIMQMQNFDRFLNANAEVGKNADAEWQSKENMIKDQMQMQYQKAQAGQANMQSGINAGLGALSAAESGKLYDNALKSGSGAGGSGRITEAAVPLQPNFSQIASLMGKQKMPQLNIPNLPSDSTWDTAKGSAYGSIGR